MEAFAPKKRRKRVDAQLLESLKISAKTKNLSMGTSLHEDILKRGLLGKNPFIASALINMYAKCGALSKAQSVLDQLPARDAVCWSALIAGYAQHSQPDNAWNCFQRMKLYGLPPNASTFTCILKAISNAKALDKGERVHEEILGTGLLRNDAVLGAALVNMYAKCGALKKAQQVFDQLPLRDAVTWTTLITAYAQQEQSDEALKCFQRMEGEGLSPDAITLPCILKAIGSTRALEKGEEIHHDIIRKGILKKDIVLGTALVDMYAKCGALVKAHRVFNELPVRNLVSWTALITGYVQLGWNDEALKCYEQLQNEGLSPDSITFACILNACGNMRALQKGERIYEQIAQRGLLKKDCELGTALVDMYAKCGMVMKAQRIFNELPAHDVVSWTALISGYVQQGQCSRALKCFQQMKDEGLSPDSVTLLCILKACSNTQMFEMGKQIHEEIISRGLLHKSVELGAALVDMYSKCGMLTKAQEIFDDLPMRHIVIWNALIAAYANQGLVEEALICFRQIEDEGLFSDGNTFAFILKACGNSGSIRRGKQIHDEIISKGLLEKDVVVGTALIYMYAKCGLLAKAQQVFDELPQQNIASWSALIAGYAQQGQADQAFHQFEKMLSAGFSPNNVTYLCVLNACSHSGLLDESQMLFENMSKKYGVVPNTEHHTCLIDIFGRAGHFDKAMSIIEDMPFSDILAVWRTLLGACKKWGNVPLGRFAFDQAVRIDNTDTAAYILMSNIYASAGLKEDAERIEAMKLENSA